MPFRCPGGPGLVTSCGSERVLITGGHQEINDEPYYGFRCQDCGYLGYSRHPEIIMRWAQRHSGFATGRTVPLDRMIDTCAEMLCATNDVLKDMPFKESNVIYTQLHDRVNLEPVVIRALKKAAPMIFPEYTDLQRAKEELKLAQERVERMTATWKALGATPKKVKVKA